MSKENKIDKNNLSSDHFNGLFTQYNLRVFCATLISLIICAQLYPLLFQHLALDNFKLRTIGASVLQNYSVSTRVLLYLSISLSPILFFSFFNYILSHTFKLIFERDSSILIRLSEITFVISIIHLITHDSFISSSLFILYGLILTLFASWSFEYSSLKLGFKWQEKIISQKSFKIIIFLTSINLALLTQLIFFNTFDLNPTFLGLVWIFNFILIILANSTKKVDKFFFRLMPLNALCILPVIANELQFTLASYINNPLLLLLFLGLIPIIISIAMKHRETDEKHRMELIGKVLIPLNLVGVTLITFYQETINIVGKLDLFHLGEANLPVHQLINFGKIPFLEIFPTHGLSNLMPQLLFGLFNGFNPLEGFIWFRFMYVILVILFYFLLVKGLRFSFLTASLITLFLPINYFFNLYYAFAIIFFLSIKYVFKSNPVSLKSLLVIAATNLITILWRLDFGIASVLVTMFLYTFYLLRTHTLLVKKTLFFVLFSVVSITVLSIIIRLIPDLNKIVQNMIIFSTFQNESMGISEFSSENFMKDSFQYLILPAISVLYLIIFALKPQQKRKIKSVEYMLIAIAMFSLIVSTRSLQRHSLIEGVSYNYLFVFLLICLPIFIFHYSDSYKYLIARYAFYVFSIFAFMIPLGDPNYSVINLNTLQDKISTNLVNSFTKFKFYNWSENERRIKITGDASNYSEIVEFLQAELKNKQTFYDLSNATLLYVLANKEFPTYIIPSIYHTSDLLQKNVISDLIALKKENRLPLVIFKQGSGWDAVDGVDSEVRSYKIAEYIYTNYIPYRIVGTYQVWSEKINEGITPEFEFDQKLNLGYLPFLWANYDKKTQKNNLKRLIRSDSNILLFDKIPQFDTTSGNYIEFIVKPSKGGVARLFMDDNNDDFIQFKIIESNKSEKYLIRVSMLYNWFRQPKKITLEGKGFMIESLSLLEGD